MRMKYVLKPLALSALAVGLLFVGTPAVQAAQNGDAPQGYKQKGDRNGRQDADRGGRQYDRKDSKNHPNGRMDGRHDNRSEQGEKWASPATTATRATAAAPVATRWAARAMTTVPRATCSSATPRKGSGLLRVLPTMMTTCAISSGVLLR